MPYKNVGAFAPNGKRIKSKKELKEIVAKHNNGLSEVAGTWFDSTSMFDTGAHGTRITDLEPGLTYQVCGPDPYNNRKWYASVSLNMKTGKVTVK